LDFGWGDGVWGVVAGVGVELVLVDAEDDVGGELVFGDLDEGLADAPDGFGDAAGVVEGEVGVDEFAADVEDAGGADDEDLGFFEEGAAEFVGGIG
jgi:hypothetical protein